MQVAAFHPHHLRSRTARGTGLHLERATAADGAGRVCGLLLLLLLLLLVDGHQALQECKLLGRVRLQRCQQCLLLSGEAVQHQLRQGRDKVWQGALGCWRGGKQPDGH